MEKKSKKPKIRLAVKIVLCLIYVGIIAILITSAYRLFEQDRKISNWKEVKSTNNYTKLKVSQMSEVFATIKESNKQFHFVMEKEANGNWHTYLVAIKKDDYKKYKSLIDYTYERTKDKPNEVEFYGYPRKISKSIKTLAIKHIKDFVPVENKVVLTEKNFEKYVTNTYLDTTIPKTNATNYIIVVLLTLVLVLFVLIVFTLIDKDKIVDEVDNIIEKELDKGNKIDDKDEDNNIETEEEKEEEIEIL